MVDVGRPFLHARVHRGTAGGCTGSNGLPNRAHWRDIRIVRPTAFSQIASEDCHSGSALGALPLTAIEFRQVGYPQTQRSVTRWRGSCGLVVAAKIDSRECLRLKIKPFHRFPHLPGLLG
jgi:hypothetical protein